MVNRDDSYMIFAQCQHGVIRSPTHIPQKQRRGTWFIVSIFFDDLAVKYNLPDIAGGYVSLEHSDPRMIGNDEIVF